MHTRSEYTPLPATWLGVRIYPDFLQNFRHRILDRLTSMRTSQKEKSALRQLAKLDERELRDIGISRDDVIQAQLQSPFDSPTAKLNDVARRNEL